MLKAHCACQKATLYLSPAIAAKVESLVTDIVTDVSIRFPIIDQRSEGVHYFHRVVGLQIINIRQWFYAHIYELFVSVIFTELFLLLITSSC